MSGMGTAGRGSGRGRWGTALAAATVWLVLATSSSALAAGPVGCGYGDGGAFASNLCWFDMSDYDDALARSPSGQAMSVTLPGGYVATFTLTSRPVAGAPQYPAVEARAVPLEQRFAFGKAGYVGVPGRPALYSFDAGAANGVELRLDDIRVVDSSGAQVTGYSFVVADAENNIASAIESFTWTSDKPLSLVGVLNPTSTRGCHNGLAGLGTTSVTCAGQGSDPPGATSSTTPLYDGVVVGADTPSAIGLSLRTAARSGVAFAIMTSRIAVTKSVVGRVRASDSFDVSATSPEGSAIATASTGPGSSATTGALTVLPRADGSSYTLGEVATPGSGTRLADYAPSWSCLNNGLADPSLPSGGGTAVAISPAAGDDIACTVTNTQLPADLSLAKSAAPSPAVPGTNETYTLLVSNAGPSRATNVRVSDPLPSGLSFVSAGPACGEAGGTVTCTLDTLDGGASRTFTVIARVAGSVDGCADIANTATVTSDTPDSNAADDASTVCPAVAGRTDLSIAKAPSSSALPVGGGQVMYTLVISNDGPSDATGVTVTDPMPLGLTLDAAQASQGSCSTAGGHLSCALGRLRSGGSAQVLVTTRAWGNPGAIANTASVTGDQVETHPADNSDTTTVTVPLVPSPATEPAPAAPFDLVVTKTASESRVVVGQPVTYRIVVANRGAAAAPDVRLADTLNAPVSVASSTTTAGHCNKRIPLRCSLGTIAAGAAVTVTVVARHTQPGCRQRNAASATGAAADAAPADNVDAVSVCAARIELRLRKDADRRQVTAGGLVSYTIRVTNPSKGVAREVRTCDRLPAGLVRVGSTGNARLRGGSWCWRARAIGAGRTKRYRITVRVLPGVRGARVNRATVSGSPQARVARAQRMVRVRAAVQRGGGVTG